MDITTFPIVVSFNLIASARQFIRDDMAQNVLVKCMFESGAFLTRFGNQSQY